MLSMHIERKSNKKCRKKGAIVNLSSMAGRVPTPMLSVYSGTKAYVDFFSKCLAQEYKSQGIVVQSVTPGMVVSILCSFMFCYSQMIRSLI